MFCQRCFRIGIVLSAFHSLDGWPRVQRQNLCIYNEAASQNLETKAKIPLLLDRGIFFCYKYFRYYRNLNKAIARIPQEQCLRDGLRIGVIV